jgi:uncharacterized protein (TIGR02421 family)
MISQDEKQKISQACEALYSASRSIRILTHLSWKPEIREAFLAADGKELPQVDYPAFDPDPTLQQLKEVRKQFQFEPLINDWLEKIADRIATSACMLSACGTPQFLDYSKQLYGAPEEELTDSENTSLALAQQFDNLFEEFKDLELGAGDQDMLSADELAVQMKSASQKMFGDQAPKVQVVDELSANALAGPRRIRIRRGAEFSSKDVQQLIHHESHIHVATSLNGINQPDLKILAAAHPGTTRTQEGLAVFAEFITGSMDLDRFRRLADRVIAIQMAIEGADFLEVFRFFWDRTGEREQAFENTRRVFRGGVVTGGTVFTKDIVYLDGLLRVHNFLRTMVNAGRADCLRLLFCGKLDIEDLPVLGYLYEQGLCQAPKYLPDWARDIRFLLCYLIYSSYLNKIDLTKVKLHYREILDTLPEIH